MGDQLAPGAVSVADMLAENAVMEFPYALPGLPKVLNGKAAILKRVEALEGMIRVERFSSPIVHRTSSGFVLEFNCSGLSTQTGRVYNHEYVSIITLRDGLIVRYRNYWNPLRVLNVMKPSEGAEEERDAHVYPEGARTKLADERTQHILETMPEVGHEWYVQVPVTVISRLYPRALYEGRPDLIENVLPGVAPGEEHWLMHLPHLVFTREIQLVRGGIA